VRSLATSLATSNEQQKYLREIEYLEKIKREEHIIKTYEKHGFYENFIWDIFSLIIS
jgi:hypothetical protein